MKTIRTIAIIILSVMVVAIPLQGAQALTKNKGSEMYAGDYVIASNTRYTETLEAVAPELNGDGFVSYGIHPNTTVDNASEVKASAQNTTYNEGDTRNFTVLSDLTSEKSATETIEFVCVATGRFCNVWTPVSTELHPVREYGEQLADNIQSDFDINYSTMIGTFGKAYLPGDKLNIMLYDLPDGENTNSNTAVSSYFRADNYVDNGVAMINIDTYPTLNKEGAESALASVYHEFQHLINYSTCCVFNAGTQIDAWFSELLSIQAEQLTGARDCQSKAEYIWNESELPSAQSLYALTNTFTDYPMLYLFGEYLRAHGGYQVFTKAVAQYVYLGSEQSVQEAILSAVSTTDLATLTLDKLSVAFRTALVAQEESGIYSFCGNEKVKEFTVYATTIGTMISDTDTICNGGARVYRTKNGTFAMPCNTKGIVYTVVSNGAVTVDGYFTDNTVTYRDWNGTVLAKKNVANGDASTYCGETPERTGRTFAGWTAKGMTVAKTRIQLARVLTNITVYATYRIASSVRTPAMIG